MNGDTYLVTGALGCIGSWILRALVKDGAKVIAADIDIKPLRPSLIMTTADLANVRFIQLDITEPGSVQAAIEQGHVTHVIHMAGLQIPFCRSNPSLGARVNVEGTANVFEAVRAAGSQIKGMAFASSVAVFGPPGYYTAGPLSDAAPSYPQTLYGVYKQADESMARVYWRDWQIPSVALRPYAAFGVGRDQGLTSDLTKAILAAAAGKPYHIRFGGVVALQYNEDLARMFVACVRSGHQGAAALNIRNDVTSVREFVEIVKREAADAAITYERGKQLPFPAELIDSGLRQLLGQVPHTPLVAAIRQTMSAFRTLLAQERIDLAQLAA